MKRVLPLLLAGLVALGFLAWGLRSVQPTTPFDLRDWASLPVQDEGRIKPIDTVARSTLLRLHGKQTVKTPDGRLTAAQWLWLLLYQPDVAHQLPVFRLDEPGVVSLLGVEPGTRNQFAYVELRPFLPEINRQFHRLPQEASERNRFEQAIARLYAGLIDYQSLEWSLKPPPMEPERTLADEVARFEELLRELPAQSSISERDPMFNAFLSRYQELDAGPALAVVPRPGAPWQNLWAALRDDLVPPARDPVVHGYARLTDAAAANDAPAFNAVLSALRTGPLAPTLRKEGARLEREVRFNATAPFEKSEALYVLVFLLVCGSWIASGHEGARRTAVCLLAFAFAFHTAGLGWRIAIQSLPPVTNLYSSAVFIGWAAAGLGLVLERLARNGLGAAAGALVGFSSLLVAGHLALSGDTMEQMRAVLNSNFWLTTHVLSVTLGYVACFVAGFLALLFLVRAIFTPSLDREAARTIEGMVFGTVCFALLFSFVGTVLGGIWADQSWGRFWGWDPKENGALLIVIWNALLLHAHAARIVRRRGFMVAALFGNIVTSWSWFGTNMLGIGLHSYGFMNEAFQWLLLFWLVHLAAIGGALALPLRRWRSQPALDTPRPSH